MTDPQKDSLWVGHLLFILEKHWLIRFDQTAVYQQLLTGDIGIST